MTTTATTTTTIATQSNCIVTYQYRNLINDPDSLIKSIQQNKNIDDDEIKQIIYSGGLPTESLKLIKPYNVKFLQQYHQLSCQDVQQQKHCYELIKPQTDHIPQKLLPLTFTLIQKWLNLTHSTLVIYGSSLIPLGLTQKISINNCQTEDIDVAVNNMKDAKALVDYVAAEFDQMMRNQNPELINILGPDVRFKYINICQYEGKFLVRIDLADKCPNFHFLKRFRLLDVTCVTDFLSYSQPSIYPNIQIQCPISFILGVYDKYAACLLNVNKLTNLQQSDTKLKMEQRIANLTYDVNILRKDEFNYFLDKFNNIKNCSIVQEMVNNILVGIKE